MLMGSVWMIGESKMRQILVPNASGLATSCFIMLMLCPLPISLYVNNLQKGKYKKIFQSICFIEFYHLYDPCILQALQIILRQCQQHTQSLLLLSLLSFLLS